MRKRTLSIKGGPRVAGALRLLDRAAGRRPRESTVDDSFQDLDFDDALLQEKWTRESLALNIRLGARTLFFVNLIVLILRIWKYVVEGAAYRAADCPEARRYRPGATYLWTVRAVELSLLVLTMPLLMVCERRPRLVLYLPVIFLWYVYVLFLGVPPLHQSCEEIDALEACIERKLIRATDLVQADLDCDLQGHTVVQIIMAWIMLTPRVVPFRRLIHFTWVWIWVLYLGFTVWRRTTDARADEDKHIRDVALALLLLNVATIYAISKKFYIDKSQKHKFIYDEKRREVSEKMFHILEYMVPEHVIVPMLRDPKSGVAEQVNRASILFIWFEGFDQTVHRLSAEPEKLLDYLNRYFTQFDKICTQHEVTKIETVGEEYVAAVGVTPADKVIDAEKGHQDILGRLFEVAMEILDLADSAEEEVVLKMGIHTGPVVAGVIGQKLPRFRLFGDTINTAARMMQKGLPGNVQFGKETYELLPAWVPSVPRGEIEMKGKGQVMTYLLDREVTAADKADDDEDNSSSSSSSSSSGGGSRASQGGKPPPSPPSRPRRPSLTEQLLVTEGVVKEAVKELDERGCADHEPSPAAGLFRILAPDTLPWRPSRCTHSAELISIPIPASASPRLQPAAQEAALGAEPQQGAALALLPLQPRRVLRARLSQKDIELATVAASPPPSPRSAPSQGPSAAWIRRGRTLTAESRRSETNAAPLLSTSSGDIRTPSSRSLSKDSMLQSPNHRAPDWMSMTSTQSMFRSRSSSRGMHASRTMEEAARMKFESALQEVTTTEEEESRRRGTAWWMRYLSPGWDDVPEEHETAFLQWYHEGAIVKKLGSRLDKQALGLSVLTAVEMAYTVLYSKAFSAQHEVFGGGRMEVFLTSRAIPFVLLVAWRIVAGARDWIRSEPAEVQRRLLCTYIAIATLMFVSYDCLTVVATYEESGELLTEMSWKTHMFSILFVFIYHIVTAQLPFLFVPACSFVLLAAVLMILVKAPWVELNFRNMFFTGPIIILFMGVSWLNAFIAHNHETSLRARFKARLQMEDMHDRIESILNTLMPPKVVEELRGLPALAAPPSHLYLRATIAQSDLCGFTQLASQRQPQEVVNFISEIFGLFDELTDEHEVYKVETVGDAYIAGQAEPPLTQKSSPLSVVLFALDMVRATHEWSRKRGENVSCRVGVHHGSAIGGIVGEEMQRYHLFGETMSVLEVLEATAPEGRVQASQACKMAAEGCMPAAGADKPQGGHGHLVTFEERTDDRLTTSKGEVHTYYEVGGQTHLVRGYKGKFAQEDGGGAK